jgi:hypothetical protein
MSDVVKCPDCGRMVAVRFPLHACPGPRDKNVETIQVHEGPDGYGRHCFTWEWWDEGHPLGAQWRSQVLRTALNVFIAHRLVQGKVVERVGD